jgi:hypothetical protein
LRIRRHAVCGSVGLLLIVAGVIGLPTHTVTWDQYDQAADLPMMRAEYDDAFADIAERLTARFGGQVIERTVDGTR